MVEALVAEPHGDGKGTGAVVAKDDVGRVGIELGVGAGRDLVHGDVEGIWEGGGGDLPGLAHVQENGRVGGLLAELEEGYRGDLWIKHKDKDTVPLGGRRSVGDVSQAVRVFG